MTSPREFMAEKSDAELRSVISFASDRYLAISEETRRQIDAAADLARGILAERSAPAVTVAGILDGPKAERRNSDARAGIPMTAAEVRLVIEQLERDNPNKAARRRLAEVAVSRGNLTPEGRDLYRAYLEALK